MRTRNLKFKTTVFVVAALTLSWLTADCVPNALGVVPPPDGGYPNFTTAEGTNALKNLTTGAGNTAVGWYSLLSAGSANYNTGVGAGTLALNTGDQNTATGTAALLLNTTGANNTANGALALLHNSSGQGNTAIGVEALTSNTAGNFNTATGLGALTNNEATSNTANGVFALHDNGAGVENTAIGQQALATNQDGDHNTATGFQALFNNISADDNTAYGYQALLAATTADFNTAIGSGTLVSLDSGSNNTAAGSNALNRSTSSFGNTAIGSNALFSSTNDNNNTAIGLNALFAFDGGESNVAVGVNAGQALQTGDLNVYIGPDVVGVANESEHTYIRNINTTSVSGGGTDTVTVNLATGLLGHLSSSRRYKEGIQPMSNASETLYRLKPVTFRYKKEIDSTQTLDYGLIAEDVAEIDPGLAIRDKDGKIESVRYTAVNAMLLNEFLKEHCTVQKQQKEIDALKAELKEQRSLIKRVAETAEQNKPALQLVEKSP